MTTGPYSWKTSFRLPFTEGVHSMIHAFLRTSEHGTWQVDESMPSDVYVLNYRRGKASQSPPKLARFIRVSGSYEDSVKRSGWANEVASPLMVLKVTLRPSHEHIIVSLEHSVTDPQARLIEEVVGRRFKQEFYAETIALTQYLRELLQIAGPVEISQE
jgi:hypothetical protein